MASSQGQQIIFEWGVDCQTWAVNESRAIEVPLPYGYRLVSVLPFPYGDPSKTWHGDDTEVQAFIVSNLEERVANGGSLDPKQSYVTIYVKRVGNTNSSCVAVMWLLLEKGNTPATKIQYNSVSA